MSGWVTDVLGDEFMQLTLPMADDEQGEVVATLVRALPPQKTVWERIRESMTDDRRMLHDTDVLYIHGWSDYFFNKRFARFFTARGARFFALDLRKYGRSLREWHTPGYVSDLSEYDEDIAAALAEMGHGLAGERSPRRLILVGHSTGGLTLSLWADRHPGVTDALILNSPWLELQLARFGREVIAPLLGFQARHRPLDPGLQLDAGHYSRAVTEAADPDDPIDINLDWRPAQSMPVTAGWLKAIIDGHATVADGLHIAAPVCVLLSQRTTVPTRWTEEMLASDSVLAVDDIARAALKIGPSITIERIEGALHDVFLSRRDARNDAYARLERWVAGWAASTERR